VVAALLLLLAVPAALTAWTVLAARSAHLQPPLVASSRRQPAAPRPPTPDAETAPDTDDQAPPDAAGAPGDPGRSRDDGAPGRFQGGAAPPRPTGPSLTVPILLYHYIRGNPRVADREGFRLSVTPANFAQQMALLRADGAHTVSLGDVMAALAGGPPLPPRSVVLTFDDGHDDFAFRAVPVLEANGFTATNFVVPGFLGRSSYLSVAQLQSVAAAGMTIGAHTMHHVDLAVMAPAIADEEITRSRAMLQELTGQPVLDFAYPYGIFTPAVEAMVEGAGFRDAASTEAGTLQYASQPFILRRTEITGYDGLASFATRAGVPAAPPGWAASPSAATSATATSTPGATPFPPGGPGPRPSPAAQPPPSPSDPAQLTARRRRGVR
jgi:peptidoglycan/xylan/chitin deacetylase (PgdA/CDA1 family)